MSNNLGQIYATSKSANKYIVLESENVEVSGNFYINGTNSRMPAEFENSIRNYLPLTYGTTDSNATTLFEKFDDLSQNVLKQRKDASFNNVDICGNLTLKGSLGVLDSSTNDISYGTTGSILTSNGSGSSPSWNEPYNISYSLTSNTADQTSDTEFKVTGFTSNLLSTTNTDFSTTNDRWTPSNAGIYLVNVVMRCQRNQDVIVRIDTFIKKSNSTNIFSSVIDFRGLETDTDNFHVFSPTINAMIEVTSSDITGGAYYEFFAKIKSEDSTSVKVLGTNNYTYFYIHKIA